MLNEDEKERLRACVQQVSKRGDRLTLEQARRIARGTGLSLLAVEHFALGRGLVPSRYERNVGTIGVDGQRTLLESCAGVVGLGGLGGHVLESVGRLGVGHVVGIDPDRFSESNLNRQTLAVDETVGEPKTRAAAARLDRVNPAVQFAGYDRPFQQVGDEVWAKSSVVFDCLDSIAARHTLAEKCREAEVPLVHGAIAGWSGQVAACRPDAGLLGKLYAGEKRGLEHRLGNLPCTAAVAANLMVARAVPILLGQELPTRDRVLFFDLRDEEWQTVEL